MKTIRWGIIGCGNVTEVKSGPGFYKAAGSQLVAVMRRDAARARDFAQRHRVARWYADAAALIADPEVDAVYVATPPGTHEFYALQVLASGKPCHMEKPMSRNAAEARRMVEAFAAQGVPLFVAYYRRALPRFLKVKELLDGGTLGKLEAVSYHYAGSQQAVSEVPAPWRILAEHSGGGTFHDMMSHALDLLDFWLGPLKFWEGWARNAAHAYAVEDEVRATMKDATGATLTLEANFHAPPQDVFSLRGTQAEVRLSCFGNEPVTLQFADGRQQSFDLPNPPHVAQPLIQTVVDELRGIGRCPGTAVSALRTQQLIDDILEGYYGGREDGFWNRPWPGNT